MKPLCPLHYLILLLSLLIIEYSNAQSVAINTDGSVANGTAILDLKSNSKGLLIPRLTTVQRTAIVSPATGLLVFDTDTSIFWFFDGAVWKKLDAAGNNWSITGNSGTTAGPQFIGTTDAVDAVLKTNNTERMRWLYAVNPNNSIALINSGDLTVNGVSVGRGPGNAVSNTTTGNQALFSNTTGTNNTAFGAQALYYNTSGGYNTALGYQALASNTTASQNTAVGHFALYVNSTGYANTAVGLSSQFSSTSGYGNSSLGANALFNNSTGYDNTAVGVGALGANISGNNNIAAGRVAMNSNTIGIQNAAIGATALANNTTGNYNTAIGYGALNTNGTGNNNTALGYNANVATGNLSNATAIGNGAVVNASDKVVIGNSSVTVIGGQVGWSTLSDGRFKTNIKEDVPGLDFIVQLRPVNYNFLARKYEDHISQRLPDSIKNNPARKAMSYASAEQVLHTGFIAQEVDQVVKKNGYHFNGVHTPSSETDNYSITYDEFVVPLVKAMQQLNTKVETLSKENDLLKKQLLEITQRLNKLEAR
ncbi:tail fiber domain-containing protein [Niastella yeongjuensis]|nr:tail fiber domain-containing protein [Niastella yeongjuensis]SEP29726.1 Chaperone of endosialidase [Niastella yeongjuensis]